jgi:pyruvate,water dikinase
MTGGQPLPVPDGLSLVWEQPEDAQLFWTRDAMHFPNPLTQIDEVLTQAVYRTGLNHGFATYSIPLRADVRRIWSHQYWSVTPLMLPDDEAAAMGQRSEELLGAAMGRLMERWENEWLPAIKQLLEDWEQFDLGGASMPDLLAHLDETLRRLDRAWMLHFEIVMPSQLPVSVFDEFLKELFGSEDAFAAYRLLQGHETNIFRAGSDLWKLGQLAQESSAVRSVLESQPASNVMTSLAASEGGQQFLQELRAYLDEHGHRGETWGLSYPSWLEDPTPVIQTLRDFMRSNWNPQRDLAELAAERDRALAETRERLRTYPEAVRNEFERLLKAARDGNFLSEEHNYWIDFRVSDEVRRVFLEFGRRFTEAGALDSPHDIIHLTVDEIRETAGRLETDGLDRRDVVEERKTENARYRALQLPPVVGVAPPGPPPSNPMTIMNAKFFGSPPEPSGDPSLINGSAGSPGIARGTARVVRSLAEAERVQPGDVLVAPTTAPPWTPLFATVSAVVTDTGGALSHCAVVAREYRIPAVVGTGHATTRIRDGQLIEVDGNQGVVRILADG